MNTQKQQHGRARDGCDTGRVDADERAEPRPQRTRGLLADSQVPLLQHVLGWEESSSGRRGGSVRKFTGDPSTSPSGSRREANVRTPSALVSVMRARRGA
jgi:hypothetical protein